MGWISALFGGAVLFTLLLIFVAVAIWLGLDEVLRDRGDD